MDDSDEIIPQHFAVSYDYPVYFTSDLFDPANPACADAVSRREPRRRHRLFVVLDRGVAGAWPKLVDDLNRYVGHHRDRLELMTEPLVVEGGEPVKNDPALAVDLQHRMAACGIDRQAFALVIGGGAVQDMAGYAAATVHRGVRVVRLPTTVLSQCDSGVGVKNAINAFGVKNGLGAFAPPFAVLNDRRFLRTLTMRDTIAGMAEAVKVALIRDPAFFEWLEARAEDLARGRLDAVADLVRRSARLHLTHIAAADDPFEFGSARPLDFGHWAAHKLESLSDYRLRHGEAVAIGMALDVCYSAGVGLVDEAVFDRVSALLERLGFQLWHPALDHGRRGRPTVLNGLAEFREHLGGELTITLLEAIGQGTEVHDIRDDLVIRAIDRLRDRRRPS